MKRNFPARLAAIAILAASLCQMAPAHAATKTVRVNGLYVTAGRTRGGTTPVTVTSPPQTTTVAATTTTSAKQVSTSLSFKFEIRCTRRLVCDVYFDKSSTRKLATISGGSAIIAGLSKPSAVGILIKLALGYVTVTANWAAAEGRCVKWHYDAITGPLAAVGLILPIRGQPIGAMPYPKSSHDPERKWCK